MTNQLQVVSDIIAVVKVDQETDQKVLEWRQKALQLLKYAETMVVNSEGTEAMVAEFLANNKTLREHIETKRKEIVQPLNDQVRRINLLFKELSGPLSDADQIMRGKVQSYRAEQRRLAEETRKQLEEATASTIVPIMPTEPADKPRTVDVATGRLSGRMVWKWECTDQSKVPEEYKLLNEPMLNGIARSTKGKMEIPGIKFYQEEQLSVSNRYSAGG